MRFLLDECLSQRLVPLLKDAGHDVLHVVNIGLAGGMGDDVLEMARTDGRVLVSSDTDFGELLATVGAHLPSPVLFRQGNRAPEHQAATLLGNLEQVAEDLDRTCHRRVHQRQHPDPHPADPGLTPRVSRRSAVRCRRWPQTGSSRVLPR